MYIDYEKNPGCLLYKYDSITGEKINLSISPNHAPYGIVLHSYQYNILKIYTIKYEKDCYCVYSLFYDINSWQCLHQKKLAVQNLQLKAVNIISNYLANETGELHGDCHFTW